MLLPVISSILLVLKCDVTCQNQNFVTEMLPSYDFIEKECEFSFYLIYYLCFYA